MLVFIMKYIGAWALISIFDFYFKMRIISNGKFSIFNTIVITIFILFYYHVYDNLGDENEYNI